MRKAESLVGNPGAIHREGVLAAQALEESRMRIAKELQCKPRELVFTSGLSESDALALVGFARALEKTRRTLVGTHWVVSAIEHPSVLACMSEVERMGGTVTHVVPTTQGVITAEHVRMALRPNTVCVSVGWANSEIGSIQPLRDISQIIRAHEARESTNILFHSDAGQAPLYLHPHVNTLGVDAMSFGGNKLYGPHGVGVLFIKDPSSLSRILYGGGQEKGLRPGTESVALACGCAEAFVRIGEMRHVEAKRIEHIRDTLAQELTSLVGGISINTDSTHALPHMLNVSIPQVSGEYLTLMLDAKGIAVATKSACREGEGEVSHVVALLGGDAWRASHTLRFSLGVHTRASDVAVVIHALKESLSLTIKN